MARKKSKIDIRHLLIEAILIVFAVSLALALNEWRSNVKEKDTIDKVLKNIVSEIQSNKVELEEKLDYHLQTSQKIGAYLANDSLWSTLKYSSGVEAVGQLMPKGIYNPNLQSGAWNSAVLSGVVNSFDYDILYELSNLYQVQEDGPNSTWKIIAGFYSESEAFDPAKARQLALKFQLAFGELYKQEKSLLNSYKNVQKTITE
ncbi:hypothetical protein [Aquimarina sp. AU474]|uniref:hypothetical protein n=1 Tax=Aquimarina sp. AU474 TaxID=2108529 RepID=UPI000D68728D|nr:hypothetical protein [Aquimarina sp. AU474]